MVLKWKPHEAAGGKKILAKGLLVEWSKLIIHLLRQMQILTDCIKVIG